MNPAFLLELRRTFYFFLYSAESSFPPRCTLAHSSVGKLQLSDQFGCTFHYPRLQHHWKV